MKRVVAAPSLTTKKSVPAVTQPAAKAVAALAAAKAGQPATPVGSSDSSKDPMLCDTYVESDELGKYQANDLDEFEARLAGRANCVRQRVLKSSPCNNAPIRAAPGPKKVTAPAVAGSKATAAKPKMRPTTDEEQERQDDISAVASLPD